MCARKELEMNQGICAPLFLILLTSSWTYLQTPENATVCLGSVSNISCASTNAQTIFYYVNGTAVPSSIPEQGLSVSAQISIGNVTLVMLTVQGKYPGVSQIECRILLVNGTLVNSFSYFTVQGVCSQSSTVLPNATVTAGASSTDIRVIVGGVVAGVGVLIIIITIIILVSYCRKKSTQRCDMTDYELKKSSNAVDSASTVHMELKTETPNKLKDYTELTFIGAGKSGVVITAKYDEDKEVYAIKTCRRDEGGVSNENEFDLLNKVKNISGCVRYYDTWLSKPPPDWKIQQLLPWTEFEKKFKKVDIDCEYRFIKLEYCIGGNLKVWITKGHSFNAYDFFNQLLDAVIKIHSNFIYHGDLIVQNVFVAYEENMCKLKIGDFAKAFKCPHDRKATCSCTDAFKRDIFDLGVILMQLIHTKQKGFFPTLLGSTKLYDAIASNGAAEIQVIEWLCGKHARGNDGKIHLTELRDSKDYENWRQLSQQKE